MSEWVYAGVGAGLLLWLAGKAAFAVIGWQLRRWREEEQAA